jgi:hypothetical protein
MRLEVITAVKIQMVIMCNVGGVNQFQMSLLPPPSGGNSSVMLINKGKKVSVL